MGNGNKNKSKRLLWNVVNDARSDISEIKAMLRMHIEEKNVHHIPPCKPIADMQKTILSAAGAAILALLSAIGSLALNFARR